MQNEDQGRFRSLRRATFSVDTATSAPGSTSTVNHHDPFISSGNSSSRPASLTAEPEAIVTQDIPSDYDEHESDDPESSPNSELSASSSSIKHQPQSFWQIPEPSRLQKNVLKCSLAYLLASLFTFIPYLSGFLADVPSRGKWGGGPSPSGHMVATIVAYFVPAKTVGAMVEADIYVIFGVAFSSFVSLGSMGMFWFLEVRPGWEWLADALALSWIAGAIIVVAWLKVWMARPSFNTACSMICVIIFVVTTKEGSFDTLLQVSFIVLIGSLISNFICLSLWTESATANLQADISVALSSFSTLFQTLTRTFLLDPDFHLKQSKLLRAIDAHQASFTSLKRNLTEAHSEWIFRFGNRDEAYDDAVDCLNRLAQHLGGMRSGTSIQRELAKAVKEGKIVVQPVGIGTPKRNKGKHNAFEELTGEGEETETLKAAAAMFGDLVDDLGPPTSALANACTATLSRMQDAFRRQHISASSRIDTDEFYHLAEDIERALFVFDSTSNHAVMRLYRRSDAADQVSLEDQDGKSHVLAGGDNETVFLVYFFIFTIQEFARELVLLSAAMGRIYALEQGEGMTTLVPNPPRSKVRPIFPKVKPHAPNTMQTPSRSSLTFLGRLRRSFWELGARIKEPDIKYAVKTGVAAAMLASPAFFDDTRQIFIEYRGEWALLSFFVVISPVIGQTNSLAVHRVLGTFIGAGTAVATYLAFSSFPALLALCGFLYSIPCFYYIVAFPKFATTGRLTLLAYNLTCLYSFNLRDQEQSVVVIGIRRTTSVTIGVLWAFIVSHFWWPTEARRELGKALSEFCFDIGWLYSRMVVSYSTPPEALCFNQAITPATPSERTPLLSPVRNRQQLPTYSALTPSASDILRSSIHEFMAMELHLQRKLIALQDLLAQTQHEPRLKGPFPVKLYRSILTSLQTILDKLHSMRCVTTREEWWTVRKEFIVPVRKERRELVGNVILYFSTLASAFRLKAPLPPYLPPAEKSRQELVDAIRRLEVVKAHNVKGSRQLLYFAYALMMKGVIQELDFLGRTLQEAFGVLGGSLDNFENIFRSDGIVTEEASYY
ncbi:Fusaric acid resistance protein-like-domain-containing protein [Hysterangium stoloniferum]|nr:Fusaric acid resistance protein-like-domain-containing protein [Hysterangium stoloniferum]